MKTFGQHVLILGGFYFIISYLLFMCNGYFFEVLNFICSGIFIALLLVLCFKKEYIFGGEREGDRVFVANLIKKATGMTDEQYIKFVDDNQNKSWNEIEPVELRETLIQAFAENIISNRRYGDRAYNEFYGSNPKKVMFTWTYSFDSNEKISNPLEFLNRKEITEGEKIGAQKANATDLTSVAERTEFLRQYSLERNLPMFIFGD